MKIALVLAPLKEQLLWRSRSHFEKHLAKRFLLFLMKDVEYP